LALYLIRCARAERPARWDGSDELRPLVAAGRAQAATLAAWLSQVPVSHVASSRFTRCVETVAPTAQRHDLDVEESNLLAPTKDVEAIVAWIRVMPDHSELCSHGAVIARVMEILTRQGAELEGRADWRKAAT
jgi:phosphohistidine phosphatase SixA